MNAQFEDRPSRRSSRLTGELISPYIPTRTVEDNLIINQDGSHGVAIRCDFPNLFLQSADSTSQLFLKLRTALNILPNDYDVQFIFGDHGRADEFLENLNCGYQHTGLLADFGKEQLDQLRYDFAAGNTRWMVGYVCLVRKNPFTPAHFRVRDAKEKSVVEKMGKARSLFGILCAQFGFAELNIRYDEAEWETVKNDFCETADLFYKELLDARLNPKVADADGALELLYWYWNPSSYDRGGRARKWNPVEDIPISSHFLPASGVDIEGVRESGVFRMDDQYTMVATLESMPEMPAFSQFAEALLPSGMRGVKYIITLHHEDIEKRKKTVGERLPELEGLAKKKPEWKFQWLDAVRELEELGKGLEKAWSAQQTFIIQAPTKEGVKSRMGKLSSFAEKTSGMKITPESHASLDFLIASQPFWTRDKDETRFIPFSSSQATTQLPTFGQPGLFDSGNGNPGITGAVFQTATAGLVNLYPHDKTRYSNYNILLIGGSGKGKGVTVNTFIAQTRLRRPSRFIVIDADVRSKGGGSYRRTAECLGGDYIDFDLTTKGRVCNPFYTQDNHFPDSEELDAMVTNLERFLVTPTQRRLEQNELSDIEFTIKQLFRNIQGKREVILNDFRKLALESERMRHLASRLGRWTADGSYANLADGQNGLNINKWLTVFNLTKIKDNPTVSPIVFANIFATVGQLATRYKDEDLYLIYDECADFLKDELVAMQIDKSYRQLRKAGVSVIGMSQTVEEFIKAFGGSGITGNVDHLLLLQQGTLKVAEMIRDAFMLSDNEFGALLNLKSDPGNFSQVLVRHKMGDGTYTSDVVVVRPTPIGYAMATTTKSEIDRIDQLRGNGRSFEEAVREFAQLYPQGMARTILADTSKENKTLAA